MEVGNLFNGVAVIIDDELNTSNPALENILRQIKDHNIPTLTYTSIPDEQTIIHFNNLSFLLLDWRLIKPEISPDNLEQGVSIPATLHNDATNEHIVFIRKIKEVCFCPVFIFTNEDKDEVISKLEQAQLFTRDKPSHIFIKSKNDLQNGTNLFDIISAWLKENPSVYVLKEWEREYQKCKNKLFSDFQDLSPVWPQIIWKNFEDDGGNKSLELGELISRNLHTRMTPFEFNDELLSKDGGIIERDELRRVLEGERFLKELHPDAISSGDVFKEEYTEGGITKHKYWINIRAQCDLLRNSELDKTELYCLRGRVINESDINTEKGIMINEGQFLEKTNHSIIPFIDNGLIIEFLFRDIKIKKWKELKNKRIGRLLPPYLTKIQQRYALYLHRQGLPRIPDAAIS
jgi:hypothetical protein